MPTIYVVSKDKENITLFRLKIVVSIALKNRSILQRRFIVVSTKLNADAVMTSVSVIHLISVHRYGISVDPIVLR